MYAWARTGREHENNRVASPCSETCNSGVSGTWKAAEQHSEDAKTGSTFQAAPYFSPTWSLPAYGEFLPQGSRLRFNRDLTVGFRCVLSSLKPLDGRPWPGCHPPASTTWACLCRPRAEGSASTAIHSARSQNLIL